MGFFSNIETTSSFTSGNVLIPDNETVLTAIVDIEEVEATQYQGECIKVTFEVLSGPYAGQSLTKKIMQNADEGSKDYNNAVKILSVFSGLNRAAFDKYLSKLDDLSDLTAQLLSKVIAGQKIFVTVGVMTQEYTSRSTGVLVSRDINFVRSLFVEQPKEQVKEQVKQKEKEKAQASSFDDSDDDIF
jgi:hypothetical protein